MGHFVPTADPPVLTSVVRFLNPGLVVCQNESNSKTTMACNRPLKQTSLRLLDDLGNALPPLELNCFAPSLNSAGMAARSEQNQRLWRSYGPSLPTVLAFTGYQAHTYAIAPRGKRQE